MGTVYLGRRVAGDFDQDVAIKVLHPDLGAALGGERFLSEIRATARLQHPHIARLLDGGVSDDGRPYFVMEHVLGVPITQYCRDHALTLTERLGLFETVCHAVQAPHRRTVVPEDVEVEVAELPPRVGMHGQQAARAAEAVRLHRRRPGRQ